jgi:hypothetical protein
MVRQAATHRVAAAAAVLVGKEAEGVDPVLQHGNAHVGPHGRHLQGELGRVVGAGEQRVRGLQRLPA